MIFGSWTKYEDVGGSWMEYDERTSVPQGFPTETELLFASYGGSGYDGHALVIYERDGTLYEATGSHCSCFGLEGQWAPEETSWAALAMRQRPGKDRWPFLDDHDEEARAAYWALVDARVPPVVGA